MLLILQTAQDIHVRLDGAIHSSICLRYQYHLTAYLLIGVGITYLLQKQRGLETNKNNDNKVVDE